MQKPVAELIRQRFSCRTYLDQPIEDQRQRRLAEFLAVLQAGPLGSRARFALVAASPDDPEALRGLGTYGYIKDPTGYIVGAAERSTNDLEGFGYLMEQAILFATDLGLGTCWLGGTFAKSRFAGKLAVRRNETMPAVAAVGLIAPGPHARDLIRRQARGAERLSADRLFFEREFGRPLPSGGAGAYAAPLEALRWAPSASNKQPWRVVRADHVFHFYLARTRRYGKGSLLFRLLQLADLQRVDLGIAMCHFELTARETGLAGQWVVQEPNIATPDGRTEYIVSWIG
jgi:nitroreductase